MSDLQGNTQDKRRDPYPPERREARSGVAGKELSQEHRRKLRTSALSEEQVNRLQEAGYHSTADGRLIIPYRNPDGSPLMDADGRPWIRWRRSQADIDRDPDGGKYRSRKGAGCRIYHPALSPSHAERLADSSVPLRITEGEFKAEACAVHDQKRITVAIGGVSSWRDRRSGRSAPIPELEAIPIAGREVRICFDSDLDKRSVRAAIAALAKWLHRRGATVLLEKLPNAPERDCDGEIERLGADDLIYRHSAVGFLSICSIAEECIREIEEEDEDGNTTTRLVFVVPYEPEPVGSTATFIRAIYLTALLGRFWRRDEEKKDGWWHWTGDHWERVDGDDRIEAAIERFLDCQNWREARNAVAVSGLRKAFRRQIQTLRPVPLRGVIPCRNGLLRLTGGTLLPHAPENGNRWALSIDWNPLATPEPIERFLLDTLGDAASVSVVRAAARAALLGVRQKVFLELYGVADSGKSVVARLLTALVGAGNYAAMDLEKFEDRSNRFQTYKLRDKRLAIFNEAQRYTGPLENLKAATGGDLITAERKNSTADVDFHFHGLVLVVGNGPIRPSDSSAAVLARRRSLYAGTPIPPERQQPMLEPTEGGGWSGELAPSLPGLLRWVVDMPEEDARAALRVNVASPQRIEAELATLLETDGLAAWADEHLVYDPSYRGDLALRIGGKDDDPEQFAYASYRRMVEREGGNRPVGHNTFRARLVALLRDHLKLPLPPGPTNTGEYRKHRTLGATVPLLRFRHEGDGEVPGIVQAALQARMYRNEPRGAKTPVGDELSTGVTNFGAETSSSSQPQTSFRERDSSRPGDEGDERDELSRPPRVGGEKCQTDGAARIGRSGESSASSSRPSPDSPRSISLTGVSAGDELTKSAEKFVTPGAKFVTPPPGQGRSSAPDCADGGEQLAIDASVSAAQAPAAAAPGLGRNAPPGPRWQPGDRVAISGEPGQVVQAPSLAGGHYRIRALTGEQREQWVAEADIADWGF